MRRAGVLTMCSLGLLVAVSSGGSPRDGEREAAEPAVKQFTLNALDHRLNIFDFGRGRTGFSRQIDEAVREFVGDILFTGDRLVVLENDRASGSFVDLGKEEKPDSEFSLFHGLRIYKRTFQLRQFPFEDRYLPYRGVDGVQFFAATGEKVATVAVELAHCYLLRLFSRVHLTADRVLLLRVIDYTPGVKVTVLWRELPNFREP